MTREFPETAAYSRVAIAVSAVVGIVVGIGSVWLTTFLLSGAGSAGAGGTLYETLFRVGPTIQGGGVGADWTTGNTIPWLDFLIALVHAADVILGVFILVLVFIHWATFRRLASRMRRPGEERSGDRVATDGGREAESEPEPEADGRRAVADADSAGEKGGKDR
jgi:hypothetical protein